MRRVRRAEIIEGLKREENAPFVGWDFSRIANRSVTTPPPWSFESLAGEALRGSRRAVDVGTGGGERLSREIGASASARIFATEGHAPNVPIARERLRPLGVQVIACAPFRLALRDSSFDLVLNSRTGLYAAEVARVLMPAGWLLTEQVGPGIGSDLRRSLGLPSTAESDHGAELTARSRAAGLTIERLEAADCVHIFRDVGAIVYFLRAVPWAVPGFSVDAYLEPLLALHDRIDREGEVAFSRRMWLLTARRPA